MSWKVALLLGTVMVVAVCVARFLQDTETGTATWDAARASGFAGYLLLWLSTVTGIALHMRFRPLQFSLTRSLELHRITSALALSFVVAHVLALLLDPVVQFNVIDGIVPFTSDYRSIQVGMGTIAQWLLVLVLSSTALAGVIPYSWWRQLHYLGFPCYVLSLLHGFTAGSDSTQVVGALLYAVTAASVAFLLVLRVVGRGWAEASEPVLPQPRGL